MNIQLKKPEGEIVCEYDSVLPFVLEPTGNFTLATTTFSSYLTGSYSNYWCSATPTLKSLR